MTGRYILLLICMISPLTAQDWTLEFQRERILMGQSVVLELKWTGKGSIQVPEIPESKDFSSDYLGPSFNSYFVIDGGKMQRESSVVHSWRITPLRSGNIMIPPLAIMGDKDYGETDTIGLLVEEPGSSEGYSLSFVLNENRGILGQAIEGSLIFSFTGNVDNINFHVPQIESNIHHFQPVEPTSNSANLRSLTIGGKEFLGSLETDVRNGHKQYRLVIPFLYRCTVVGMEEWEPAYISFYSFDRQDAFGRWVADERSVQSNRIALEVVSLPEEIINSPNGILITNGPLGTHWQLTPSSVRVGDPLVLNIHYTGLMPHYQFNFYPPKDYLDLGNAFTYSSGEPHFEREEGKVEIEQRIRLILDGHHRIPRQEIIYFDLDDHRVKRTYLREMEFQTLDSQGGYPLNIEEWDRPEEDNRPLLIPEAYDFEDFQSFPTDYMWSPLWFILFLLPPVIFSAIWVKDRMNQKDTQATKEADYPWEKPTSEPVEALSIWAEERNISLDEDKLNRWKDRLYSMGEDRKSIEKEMREYVEKQ